MKHIRKWNIFDNLPETSDKIEAVMDASQIEMNIDDIPMQNIINNQPAQQKIFRDRNFRSRSIYNSFWMWQELSKLFGPRNFQYQGYEFLFDVWVLSYKNVKFCIFTADEKGTSIDVITEGWENPTENKKLAEISYEFWCKFADLIKSTNTEQVQQINRLFDK